MNKRGYTFDAFLSHAVEDKIPIANELYSRLTDAGLSIWYSGSDLKPGDSIETSVRSAITHSEYGIVIFSQFFLSKNWTMNEYYSMAQLESEKRLTIIPILFDVTPEDLARKNLSMADRFAIHASKGMDYVVSKVLETIQKKNPPPEPSSPRYPRILKLVFTLVIMLLIGTSIFAYISSHCWDCPTNETLAKIIEGRMHSLQLELEKDWLKPKNEQPATTNSIDSIFNDYMGLKSRYRNEYEFSNGFELARSRRRVESILGVNLTLWTPANEYNLTTPDITLSRKHPFITYTYSNTQPVTYTITNTSLSDDGSYLVTVAFENNIRCIKVSLSFPTENDDMRRHRMRLIGFLPDETFVFEKDQDDWILREVK